MRLKEDPDWDSLSERELAIMRTISTKYSAKYLFEIKIALGWICAFLAAITVRLYGWL